MCKLCHSSPCRRGCPNAPEDQGVYVCDACGCAIHEGDRYLSACGVILCEFCIDANTFEAYSDDKWD